MNRKTDSKEIFEKFYVYRKCRYGILSHPPGMCIKKKLFVAVVLLVVTGSWIYMMSPTQRVRRYVKKYHAELEKSYETGEYPKKLGGESLSYHLWYGEHPMAEFSLYSGPGVYRGFYYSPDDLPLPFQNADIRLIPDGKTAWTWKGGGDNRGYTSKIIDCWYYYEAAF